MQRNSCLKLAMLLFLQLAVFAGLARGADDPQNELLNAQKLKQAAVNAAAMLELKEPAGATLVLPVDFFESAFSKFRDPLPPPDLEPGEPGPVAGGKLTLRDSQMPLLVGVHIARGMLDVARPERSPAQYIVEWTNQEQDILQKLTTELKLTDNSVHFWTQFFREWRAEVTRVAPNRFRDALRQAAYSILRASMDIEKEHIERVRNQRLAPATTSQTPAVRAQEYPWRGRPVPRHWHHWHHWYYGQQ